MVRLICKTPPANQESLRRLYFMTYQWWIGPYIGLLTPVFLLQLYAKYWSTARIILDKPVLATLAKISSTKKCWCTVTKICRTHPTFFKNRLSISIRISNTLLTPAFSITTILQILVLLDKAVLATFTKIPSTNKCWFTVTEICRTHSTPLKID